MHRDTMHADGSGSMDFMESMIAMMAVATVMAAFLAAAVGLAGGDASDPTGGLDPARLTGCIEDGIFVPGFGDYVEGYVESRGLSGASVSVDVPGGFCDAPAVFVYGSMDGGRWSASFVSSVEADGGRVVPVLMEVVLCGRRTAASWHWRMRRCS